MNREKITLRREHTWEENGWVREVRIDQIDRVLRLQEAVCESLPDKRWLYADTEEDMIADLLVGGMILGVWNASGELIAYRYVSAPGDHERNLGRDVGIDRSELGRVLQLETTLVRPDYRGNGLQRATLEIVLRELAPRGFRHLLCTVSPYNRYSLANIMAAGLEIKALRRKYAGTDGKGLWRFILHRDLHGGTPGISRRVEATCTVRSDLLAEQQGLLRDGFIGDRFRKESADIRYALIR